MGICAISVICDKKMIHILPQITLINTEIPDYI